MKVGQEVVCIKLTKHPYPDLVKYPIPDSSTKYTIRDVYEDEGLVGVWLDEIRNDLAGDGIEFCFESSDFRKIDECKNFTNKLTKKLANHQQENLEIYVPLEVETPLEV